MRLARRRPGLLCWSSLGLLHAGWELHTPPPTRPQGKQDHGHHSLRGSLTQGVSGRGERPHPSNSGLQLEPTAHVFHSKPQSAATGEHSEGWPGSGALWLWCPRRPLGRGSAVLLFVQSAVSALRQQQWPGASVPALPTSVATLFPGLCWAGSSLSGEPGTAVGLDPPRCEREAIILAGAQVVRALMKPHHWWAGEGPPWPLMPHLHRGGDPTSQDGQGSAHHLSWLPIHS